MQTLENVAADNITNLTLNFHLFVWMEEMYMHILTVLQCAIALGEPFYTKFPKGSLVNILGDTRQLPLSKLKLLLNSFVIPFALHCPHGRWERDLTPIFNQVFTPVANRISQLWQLQQSNNEQKTSEKLDIAQDTALRDITRTFIEMLMTLLHNMPNTPGHSGKPGQFHQYLGNDPQLLVTILQFLTSCLEWPDNAIGVRSATLLLTLIPVFASHDMAQSVIGTHLVTAAIKQLALVNPDKAYDQMCTQCVAIIVETYVAVTQSGSNRVKEALCQLPQVGPEQLVFLEEMLSKAANKKKAKRVFFDFLAAFCIGLNNTQVNPSSRIINLRHRFKVAKPKKASQPVDYAAVGNMM
jgi:hypothetical protein